MGGVERAEVTCWGRGRAVPELGPEPGSSDNPPTSPRNSHCTLAGAPESFCLRKASALRAAERSGSWEALMCHHGEAQDVGELPRAPLWMFQGDSEGPAVGID